MPHIFYSTRNKHILILLNKTIFNLNIQMYYCWITAIFKKHNDTVSIIIQLLEIFHINKIDVQHNHRHSIGHCRRFLLPSNLHFLLNCQVDRDAKTLGRLCYMSMPTSSQIHEHHLSHPTRSHLTKRLCAICFNTVIRKYY